MDAAVLARIAALAHVRAREFLRRCAFDPTRYEQYPAYRRVSPAARTCFIASASIAGEVAVAVVEAELTRPHGIRLGAVICEKLAFAIFVEFSLRKTESMLDWISRGSGLAAGREDLEQKRGQRKFFWRRGRCKSLKVLDSDKEIKGNPSFLLL